MRGKCRHPTGASARTTRVRGRGQQAGHSLARPPSYRALDMSSPQAAAVRIPTAPASWGAVGWHPDKPSPSIRRRITGSSPRASRTEGASPAVLRLPRRARTVGEGEPGRTAPGPIRHPDNPDCRDEAGPRQSHPQDHRAACSSRTTPAQRICWGWSQERGQGSALVRLDTTDSDTAIKAERNHGGTRWPTDTITPTRI